MRKTTKFINNCTAGVLSLFSLIILQLGCQTNQAQVPPPDIKSQALPTPTPEVKRWSGSYQATLNISVLGKPKPSVGHKFTSSYAPTFGGSFDSRFEYYIDGSYNGDPPGQLINNVNEPKFEGQLNYTRPLNKRFAATVGLLYHHNFKFADDYWWALGGIVYTEQLGKKVTLTAAGLVEKKFSHGRAFVDGSATLEYRFAPKWNTQLSVHRYENLGQFDSSPTQKLELEFGVNRALKHKQWIGISFFRHIQYGAPNDQFSFIKLKYGINF